MSHTRPQEPLLADRPHSSPLHPFLLPADGDGKVVTDHLTIAVNYATGWLLLDLASSLPFDNMTGEANLSCLKILRVGHGLKSL